MKRLFYSTIVFAIAFTTFSCSKSLKEEIINEEPEQTVARVFTCTFAQSDTKVSINDATGKTEWEVGDKIRIHGGKDGNKSEVYTLKAEDISADKKKAQITVTVAPYDRSDKGYTSTLYAAYPSDLVAADPMYYNTAFTTSNAPLMAAYDEGDTFVFYNLCGLITFSVTEDFDSYTFEGNNSETVGYSDYQCRLAATTTDPVLEFVRSGDSHTPSALKKITGTMTSGTNTISLATGTDFSGGFTISFLKDSKIKKTFATGAPINVARGKLLPLGNITSYLKDYVAPTTHDATHPAIAGAKDLGSSGTANCYIVDGSDDDNASKVFKFKAVKGNGSDGVGTVADVVVLWETYNNAESVTANSVIAQADFDKQEGGDYWITFKMPDTLHEGNAVIAAKDEGDNILWSWHIWVPATTVTSADYGIYTEGKNMMDRNLGALRVTTAAASEFIDVTSIGLVYQWGRKDPFVGPDKVKAESYRSWATTAGASFSVVSKVMSLEESIQNPTGFSTGSSNNKNWLSPYNTDLWGDSGSKAIYDPCPPGYRVPLRDKTKALFKDESFAGTYDKDHYWFSIGSPVTVFPCAGYRTSSDFKTSCRTIIWNSHSNDYQGSYDEPHYSAYNRRAYYESSTWKWRVDSQQYKYYGGSVRCVAE